LTDIFQIASWPADILLHPAFFPYSMVLIHRDTLTQSIAAQTPKEAS
jgi:hypothetical protein